MSFFAGVVQGIEEVASANGYNIILSNTDRSYEKEWNAVNVLINKRIDGLILAASMLTSKTDVERIRSFNIPFVYLIRRTESDDANYVVNDNVKGAESMTEYLLDTGCERIHFLNLELESPSGRERLNGYRNALTSRGIRFDPSLIRNIDHSIVDGFHAMNDLLETDKNVTCVFCGCDEIAIGVMDAALKKGFRIPGDIRVASYDDIDYAAYLQVPLTTVRQPRRRIGNEGAEMLIDLIKKGGHEARHIVIDPELVIRGSA
jgi:DNA-binding LacI/PurR family transcriptional regulator